uniref:Uncharacterized protein n=1 Tax=Sphaerodactylus townsendi TaxID=933632 RepID=A0ACB8ERJ8_9SAUR
MVLPSSTGTDSADDDEFLTGPEIPMILPQQLVVDHFQQVNRPGNTWKSLQGGGRAFSLFWKLCGSRPQSFVPNNEFPEP